MTDDTTKGPTPPVLDMGHGISTNDPSVGKEESIGFLDILIVLAKHRKLAIGVPLVAAIVATGISLFMPNIYTATAKLMPPQQSQSSASAMLSQLGGLASLGGAALGVKNPSDQYVAMLKSRTVADALIHRFQLKDVYEARTLTDTRTELTALTNIVASKDGLITVEVDDKNPKRAAELANAYVEELEKLALGLAVTEAAQRRLFFEKQLKDAREQLVKSEADLQMRIETKGLAGVEIRGRSQAEMGAQLRAQIMTRQVQVDAAQVFATTDHPDVRRLRQEISSLMEELAKTEGGAAKTGKAPIVLPAGLDNVRRLREMKFLEAKVEFLTRQFEMAKVDEAKDAGLIQVLDRAIEPEKKTKPKRTLNILLATLTAAALVVIVLLAREAIERSMLQPDQKARLGVLKAYFRNAPRIPRG